jgi:hypothetical protein
VVDIVKDSINREVLRLERLQNRREALVQLKKLQLLLKGRWLKYDKTVCSKKQSL